MKHRIAFTMLVAGLAASPGLVAHAGEVEFAAPKRLGVPDCTQLEGPEVVDYDGDGIRDLLSGVYAGHLLFRRNVGTNEMPKFAKPVKLQSAGKEIKLTHW